METSTYLLLALVMGATEKLYTGVIARKKGGGKGERLWGGVVGRPAGARERGGERTGRAGLGAGRPEGGTSGRESTGLLGGDVPEYTTGCRRRGGKDECQFVLGPKISGTDLMVVWNQRYGGWDNPMWMWGYFRRQN